MRSREHVLSINQGLDDHTNELEDYHRELISLLSWLGPHINKCNNHGSAV